nr:hypothetical protein [Tanacetum cinerariifolium]
MSPGKVAGGKSRSTNSSQFTDMNVTLHTDGQSMEFDIPPDIIIDVVDEDDDITDDEDTLHVARSYGGDGGGEDRPLHTMYPAVAWVALLTENLQKAYNTNKAAFKARYWVLDPTIGTYNVEKIRRERRENITASEWIQTSTTQEYPSLIDTFFMAHTVNEEFLRDEDRRIYETMRLEAMGTYTDDEISRLARGRKQRGHIAGVGRYCRHGPQPAQFSSGGASGSGECGDEEEGADHQDDEDEDGDGDTYHAVVSWRGNHMRIVVAAMAGVLTAWTVLRLIRIRDAFVTDVMVPGATLIYDVLKWINCWNGVQMSADVARSYGGDDRGEDFPLHTMYPAVAWVALLTEAKENESPIWAAGQRPG